MCFMNFSGLRNSFRFEKVEIISVISELKWTINPDNHLYDFSENLMQRKKFLRISGLTMLFKYIDLNSINGNRYRI